MIDLDENRMEFKYRMLGRLQQDCEYYLGNGGRDANHALDYHDEVRHIEEMKKLYDELPEIPEWLPPEKLKEYEEQLLGYKEEAKLPTEDIENVNEKQQKASSGEYVRIKVYKDYLNRGIDPSNDREYNALKMPKGVVVGDMDLSGATIFPKLVYEDKFNSNMVVAQYDRNYLKDNAVNVSIYDREKKDFESIRIDIDELRKAVDAANYEYMESKKREHQTCPKEYTEEITY